MNAMRKVAFRVAVTTLLSMVAAACGPEVTSTLSADLAAPTAREAKVTLTPALDVSFFEQALLERFVIEDIQLHVADVRLLGADPRIPAGGLVLLTQGRVVHATGDAAGLEIPFPSQFADDDDLAVYLRIDRTPELGDASVVVRARLYEEKVSGGAAALSAAEDEATDPDGDPARDPEDRVGATDPDGDPALPRRCADATDPDGDPAKPGCRRDALVQRGVQQNFVEVELRDERPADLVTGLAHAGGSDVVVGIPASRWLTPEVVAAMEAALHQPVQIDRPGQAPQERDTIVVRTKDPTTAAGRAQDRMNGDRAGDDYFLSNSGDVDSLTIRR